jgi:protein phosphatase
MAPSPESEKTAPGTDPDIQTSSAPRPFNSDVEVDLAGLSHPGRVRPNNEDHFIISRMGRYMETVGTNVPPDMIPPRFEECIHGMIVADGVGGGTAGEVASRTAISTLLQLATTSPNWIFRLDDERFVRELLHRLKERLAQIQSPLQLLQLSQASQLSQA